MPQDFKMLVERYRTRKTLIDVGERLADVGKTLIDVFERLADVGERREMLIEVFERRGLYETRRMPIDVFKTRGV